MVSLVFFQGINTSLPSSINNLGCIIDVLDSKQSNLQMIEKELDRNIILVKRLFGIKDGPVEIRSDSLNLDQDERKLMETCIHLTAGYVVFFYNHSILFFYCNIIRHFTFEILIR